MEKLKLEEWQKKRIDVIKKILPCLGENYILKGGTALYLYYGLDRFSEDIDLDSKGKLNFLNNISSLCKRENWNITIKKDTETVFRVMIDYNSKNSRGDYPLKIEVSSRNKKLLNMGSLSYKNIEGVNVYDVSEIINMKMSAFDNRDKIRDLYDLAYLLKKYPEEFNLSQLKSIYTTIQYKGIDNLELYMQEDIIKNELKKFDTTLYLVEFLDNIEKNIEIKIQEQEQSKGWGTRVGKGNKFDITD